LFTAARMLPVAVVMLGSGLRGREVAVIGWLGPRGLASVLFGLLALQEVAGADAGFVAEVVVVTVLLSIVVHGLTAGPVAASFGRYGRASRRRAVRGA
jgi:sodium/hydrogen antiporter